MSTVYYWRGEFEDKDGQIYRGRVFWDKEVPSVIAAELRVYGSNHVLWQDVEVDRQGRRDVADAVRVLKAKTIKAALKNKLTLVEEKDVEYAGVRS